MLRQITARWVAVGIALTAPASLAFVGWRAETSGRTIVVPRLLDTRLEGAFVRLRKAGLVVKFAQTFRDPPNSGMIVLSQDPGPGSRVKSGSVVTLRVGGGS
jgi:beta-lactam-binding protein with PASTA domain